jgi:hypothetical protein
MFFALATPEWIDHPVTRHVLGRRGEGRWSWQTGALPIVMWSLAPLAILLIVRQAWFPRGATTPIGAAIAGLIVLLPLLAAAAAATWQGSAGLARLRSDPLWRGLVASGLSSREIVDGMCVGFALRALIVPMLLFQAIVILLAIDATLVGSYGLAATDPISRAFFRWLMATTVFLVAAGPVLDYSLLVALAQTAAGRGRMAAMLIGFFHLLLAGVILIVGLGVFGVVFLVMRADAMRRTCQEGLLNLVQEAD